MKKPLLLPCIALVGGAAAAVLRLFQNATGFEEETGLPISGNLPGTALVILLVLLAVILTLLVRRLPENKAPSFPADFTARDSRLLFLPMAGLFLMGLSGVLDLIAGLGLTETLLQGVVSAADPSGMTSVVAISSSDGYSPQAHLILGVLDLVSAAGLLFAVRACGIKQRHNRLRFNGTWLLAPVLAMAVRLVLAYRVDSVNPALEALLCGTAGPGIFKSGLLPFLVFLLRLRPDPAFCPVHLLCRGAVHGSLLRQLLDLGALPGNRRWTLCAGLLAAASDSRATSEPSETAEKKLSDIVAYSPSQFYFFRHLLK